MLPRRRGAKGGSWVRRNRTEALQVPAHQLARPKIALQPFFAEELCFRDVHLSVGRHEGFLSFCPGGAMLASAASSSVRRAHVPHQSPASHHAGRHSAIESSEAKWARTKAPSGILKTAGISGGDPRGL